MKGKRQEKLVGKGVHNKLYRHCKSESIIEETAFGQ